MAGRRIDPAPGRLAGWRLGPTRLAADRDRGETQDQGGRSSYPGTRAHCLPDARAVSHGRVRASVEVGGQVRVILLESNVRILNATETRCWKLDRQTAPIA